MMNILDYCPINRTDYNLGRFSLDYYHILIVRFRYGCPTSTQYFVGKYTSLQALSVIFSDLANVSSCIIKSIDNF